MLIYRATNHYLTKGRACYATEEQQIDSSVLLIFYYFDLETWSRYSNKKSILFGIGILVIRIKFKSHFSFFLARSSAVAD